MATLDDSIEGKVVLLSIATNLTTPVYKTVVCAINNGLSSSADVTTVDTKCGTAKSRGSANYTLDGSFVANTAPSGTEMSADALIALMDSGANFLFKLADVDDADLYYRQGTGFFSSYNETANNKENVQGDFTIEVIGSPVTINP